MNHPVLPLASAQPGSSISSVLVVGVYAGLYLRRARTLAGEGRPVPAWRRACFLAGLGLVALALLPPLGTLDDSILSVHMLQHLLLGDLGTLLIVLGLTGPVLQPVLRLRPFAALRVLAHPVLAVGLWALDLYVWHLPALYEATLSSDAVHLLEHACFIAFGLNVWMPLLGPLPVPAWFGNLGRLVYIIAVRLAGTLLANVLLWWGTPVYPAYRSGELARGIDPLTDQTVAGSILMVEGSLITIGLFAWLFLRSGRQADERQALLDFAAQRGTPLDERRVARAVAAGRGEALRRRVAGESGADGTPGGAEPLSRR